MTFLSCEKEAKGGSVRIRSCMSNLLCNVVVLCCAATLLISCGSPDPNSASTSESAKHDSFATAQVINPDTKYTRPENDNSSNDYFQITATGANMNVDLSHYTPNAPGSDFGVTIYNSSQVQIGSFDANDGLSKSMTIGIIAGQTYYIKIYTGSAGSYRCILKVSFGSDKYEVEPNNDFSTAMTISSGVDYFGQDNGNTDGNDYFKVIAEDNSMTVSLSHIAVNAPGSDFGVTIYNSSQVQIGNFDAIDGLANSMTTGITAGQTYYIKIYVASNNYQCKLNVSFSTTHYEIEPNNDFSTAMTINGGTDYYGHDNGSSDSNDYYKVTASGSGMTVNLSPVTPNAPGSDFGVTIYNSSQLQIGAFDANDGLSNSMTTGIVSGQTYYVKIYTGSNNYEYKLRVSFL